MNGSSPDYTKSVNRIYNRNVNEGLNTQVLRGFNLKFRGATKEKACFVCNTDLGLKLVQKTTAPYEHILFQHKLKELLYNNGFTDIDRFIVSTAGTPYVIVDGDTYVASAYPPASYKETDFSNEGDFTAIVATVARMHRIIKDASPEFVDSRPHFNNTDSADTYAKTIRALKKYKKIALKQPRLSDFDVMLLKSYDFYTDCLEKWYAIASQPEFSAVINAHCVCHNLLKEETVLKIGAGKYYIQNFSECSAAHHIHDLAAIIKRHLKNITEVNQPPKRTAPLKDVIDAYNAINPLTESELTALHALLLFPDKFIKTCSKYYTKNRTWIPAAFLQRMDNITRDKEVQLEYINNYYTH